MSDGDEGDESLSPSKIAKTVQFSRCQQFPNIHFRDSEYNVTDDPPVDISRLAESERSPVPVLTTLGDEYEHELYEQIIPQCTLVHEWFESDETAKYNEITVDHCDNHLTHTARDEEGEIQESLSDVLPEVLAQAKRGEIDGPVAFLQPVMSGTVGEFDITGDADLAILWTDPLHFRVFDIKAGEEKPHHQAQATIYGLLCEQQYDLGDNLSTGIIDRDGDVSSLTPESLPEFDYRTRRSDMLNLLSGDGHLDTVFNRPDEPEHALGRAARESDYTEQYYANAAQQQHSRLLGLSKSELNAFSEHAEKYDSIRFETVADVARLIKQPSDDREWPTDELPPINSVKDEYKEYVRDLNADTRVQESVQVIAQRAQVLLAKLQPEHLFANNTASPYGTWLQGTGQAELPDDDPGGGFAKGLEIEPGTLIRVYLDVQYDYLNDRVLMISASVDCTAHEGDSLDFSIAVDHLDTGDEMVNNEERLLEKFSKTLFRKMGQMATLADVDSPSYHYYFYTEPEMSTLFNCLHRHRGNSSIDAFRRTLDLRRGVKEPDADSPVEQPMTSFIKPALDEHYAFPAPGMDIPTVCNRLHVDDDLFGEYERSTTGETIDLSEAFYYEFMTRSRPIKRASDDSFVFMSESDEENEEVTERFPTYPRFKSDLPMGYFWAADGIDNPDDIDPFEGVSPLEERFRYADTERETRIKDEDILALGRHLARGLRHIERNLHPCHTPANRPEVRKRPLPVDPVEINRRLAGTDTLAAGCRMYLDLEQQAAVEDHNAEQSMPVRHRINAGTALPLFIDDVEASNESVNTIHGTVAYDALQPSKDVGYLHYARRLEEGDFVDLTPLTTTKYDGEIVADQNRWGPDKSPTFCIEHLSDDRIELSYRFPRGIYGAPHVPDYYPRSEDGTEPVITPNEDFPFIIDEGDYPSINHNKRLALSNTDSNTLYQLVDSIRTGSHSSAELETSAFDDTLTRDFLRAIKDASEERDVDYPNRDQRDFITETTSRISLLQGPPGTGKTAATLSPALLARAAAHDGDEFRAYVTGPTNTAVDEALKDTADLLDELITHDFDSVPGGIRLLRLTHSSPDPADVDADHPINSPHVDYVNYRDVDLTNWPSITGGPQQQFGSKTIIFGTPQGAYQIANHMSPKGETPAVTYEDAPDLFDVLAVDEASMMTLPQLFTAGAFITSETSQVLITGDHRQMPPVQTHDWLTETRETILDTVPFLSTLNYFRYLRGHEVDTLARHEHEVPASPNATEIAYNQLQLSYRNHRLLARLLNDWIYEKKDGIHFHSNQTDTISTDRTAADEALEPVLDETPVSLITHDDTQSQQSSKTEQEIVAQIEQEFQTDDEDAPEIGVVTPHNAQKASLRSLCDEDTTINTVESFQGGEKDIMMLSSTVSDPAYIESEDDFILDPNRLNVALSRMKQKLVILAPETLLEMIPNDIETYEDAQIWKSLNQEFTQQEPDSTGSVEVDGDTKTYQVYTLSEED